MMRESILVLVCVASVALWGCGSEPAGGPAAAGAGVPAAQRSAGAEPGDGARLTGFAFVDSSVTGQGSRAVLPAGAKIHPLGSTIRGAEGCPTTPYRTDGLIVAVIDYQGPPTSGALTLVENRDDGGRRDRAPYYLDLDNGRQLQFLGPVFANGTYELELAYGFRENRKRSASGSFRLARECPPAG